MNLTLLTLLLGLAYGVPQLLGLMNPVRFRDILRRFPRHELSGMILMSLGTVWFLYLLKTDDISDFESFKPVMFIGFAVIGFGTCAFVRDFLAVRGLAVMVLLVAKLVLDTARWVDTEWRLVLAVWSYLWIVLAVWLTVSPWRLRDYLEWVTATESRIRLASALRLAFSLLLVGLALTAFRAAGQP